MNNQAAQTMPVIDDFNGDNAKLIESARALISLSDSGSLAPHGIGGHARAILSAFIVRTEAAALSQTAGVAEGWLRACDEEMVGAHLGVANASDDYATAKKKLNDLITWHIQVASDPAVNGGFVLVPVEPTEAMAKAGESAWPLIKNACCPWPQPEDVYAAMLAAAPAASGGEDCTGCYGNGEIGGLTPTGYDSQQCPFCNGSGKESQPPVAASVSERARSLLADAYRDHGYPRAAESLEAGFTDSLDECALAAVEQALTQQRGAVDWLAFAYELEAFKPRGELGALHGAGMAFAYKDVAKTIRAKLATTTPQPGAEALRELTEATQALLHAVCGETGFAAAVRAHSGISYPWPALDIAEERVRSVLESLLAGGGGK